MLEPKNVKTKPICEYPARLKRAFGAVCEHIDWMRTQITLPPGCDIEPQPHLGSESWMMKNGSEKLGVILKASIWDTRTKAIATLTGLADTEGIAVWVRNEILQATDVQTLRDILGNRYYPSPAHPLFRVLPDRRKVDFQIMNLPIGRDGCDLLALPGVKADRIDERLRNRCGPTGTTVDNRVSPPESQDQNRTRILDDTQCRQLVEILESMVGRLHALSQSMPASG